MKRKLAALTVATALLAGSLAGCGSGSSDQTTAANNGGNTGSTSEAATGASDASGELKTITYANAADITSLDPRRGTSTITASIMADIYSTILTTTPEGEITYDLATAYERVDEVTWHFTIREDAYFSNGDQVTSADVEYTISSLKDTEAGYSLSGDFSFMTVEVLGDFEFNIITDEPFNGLPLRLNYVKILPKKYIEENGVDVFAENPIGSGPFKFVSWEKDSKVVLEKNENYYGGAPEIDQLIYRVIPEAADRFAALEAGEVDIIAAIPTSQAAYLSSKDGVTVVGQPSTRLVWVQFNTVNGETPLDVKEVRQALNYAIDRDAIIAGVLDGYAVKVASISTPQYEDYDADVAGYTYDVEKAKELLAEGGYPNGFDIELSVTGSLLNATDVVQVVAAQLGEIGVNVTVTQEDSATQREKIMSKTVAPLFLNGIGGPYCNIDLIASIGFTEGQRYCTWADQTFIEMAQKAATVVDEAERADLHSQMQAYMVEEAPAIWLYQQSTLYAYNSDKVQNWTPRADEIISVIGASVAD